MLNALRGPSTAPRSLTSIRRDAGAITEDLIDRLTHIADLRFIAPTSSFQFKGMADDVREIGQKLGVTHLVSGSVRRAGNRVRITAQLIRADDGTHDWSKHYDRDLDDVFALQDEITSEIASQLTTALKPAQSEYQRYPSAGGIVEYLVQCFGPGVFAGSMSIILYIAACAIPIPDEVRETIERNSLPHFA